MGQISSEPEDTPPPIPIPIRPTSSITSPEIVVPVPPAKPKESIPSYGNVGWYFRPSKYIPVLKEWKNVPIDEEDRFRKDEIKILSYNVWFDHSANLLNRMKAIGDIIVQEDPDLIALQEMTPYICSVLFSQPWVLNYFVSDPLGVELGKSRDDLKYGNIILSKVNFRDLLLKDFPSNQSRKALCGSVYFNNVLFTLGTFHLESYPSSFAFRKQQLELFRSITNASEHIVLLGDSNIERDEENNALYPKFKEAWLELYNTGGYTFNSSLPCRRYDRVFYTSNTIKMNQVYYVGKETIPGGTYPSDHLGVVATISLI
jgi:endonuclease/exonuclease/phosphatase family metal-dependent hydrolase